MYIVDRVVSSVLPVIQNIIADETWLEGERRGCWVPPEDPVVRENVCQVILRIGATMRARLMIELPNAPQKIPTDDHTPHAA